MTQTFEKLTRVYHAAITDYIDERSRDWVLCTSPLVPVFIICSYLYFVKIFGPNFMKNRAPLDLRNIIIPYNAIQVAVNVYIAWKGWCVWHAELRSLLCQPVDHRQTDGTRLMADIVYMYYVLKIVDLLDTVFFVLRKKGHQASFLHVYHHSAMVVAGYLACKFTLNGHFFLLGPINAFVHAVLYSYYLVTVLQPSLRDAPWKKYITILQLVQFVILAVHNTLPLLQPECQVQKIWCALLVVQNIFVFLLFSDFYLKAYSPGKKSKTE